MDCTGGRKSCHGEKSAVLDLAAISLSVAYSIAAGGDRVPDTTFKSSAETQYLLASFRKFRLGNSSSYNVRLDLRSCYVVRCLSCQSDAVRDFAQSVIGASWLRFAQFRVLRALSITALSGIYLCVFPSPRL